MNISQKIKKLLFKDQRDRKSSKFGSLSDAKRWEIIGKRDKERRVELEKILEGKPKLKGADFFRVGIIFQHGELSDIKKARSIAEKGIKAGNKNCKWLYAAATDRILMMQKKNQKFGTQFIRKNGAWQLYSVDRKTKDSERLKYNVGPLQDIRKSVLTLNSPKKSLKALRSKKIGITRKK